MKKKVVVIGGGFAGSKISKGLENDFDVILIDTKDYFEFTPGILRTIVEPMHLRKIQVLHSHYLKRAKVVVGEVSEAGENFVKVGGKRFSFDYLVVSSGSGYNAPFKEKNIVDVTRAKNLKHCYEELCRANRILIIGGGLVGVELAGEILSEYGLEKNITIVHSYENLIHRTPERSIRLAEKYLKKRGVKIFLKERVVKKSKGFYLTSSGRKIGADMVFLCTGITPNYKFMKKNFSKNFGNKNFLKVNKFLQLEGRKNIFVAGDVAGVDEEKTAQNAERQGSVIVKNICALEKITDLKEYISKKTPMIISLGKYNGIYHHGNFVMCGIIPALMKSMVEKWEMIKKRKVS